jgi:hypothetical protein
MRTISVISMAILATSLLGCKGDKKTDDPASGAAAGQQAAASKKPAKLEWKDIDHMGLKIQVPGDATVDDTSADAPNASIAGETINVMVSTVTVVHASDFEAAKKEIKSDPNPFQKFTKEEKTADGWHLEYELKGMIDDKPLYGVSIRKKIGGKEYECGRNDGDKSLVERVAKACLSLQAK